MSHITCHIAKKEIKNKKGIFFILQEKLDNVVEVVGGGSVINGAYPVQFS